MGKFGIGACVRDRDGDLAEVIGKPRKGWREVRYSGGKWDGVVLEFEKGDLEVIGLRIEIGKTYVDRDGTQHGPLVANTYGAWVGTHPFAFGDRSWRVDGGFLPSGEDSWDLVAEVVLPAEPAKPQFEVGQRVVVTNTDYGDGGDFPYLQNGNVGKVVTVSHYIGVEFDDDAEKNDWAFLYDQIAPFTLEAGKFYRTRDGDRVEAELPGLFEGFDFRCGGNHYNDNGTHAYGNRSKDIVAEWVEPPAAETIIVEDATDQVWEPKVGDKIRRIKKPYPFVPIGHESTVQRLPSGILGYVDAEGDTLQFDADSWERVVEPQPKFKVGDRVDLYRDGQRVEYWSNMTITANDGDFYPYSTDRDLGCFEGELQLSSVHSTIAVGSDVILTAPARVTGFDKRNAHIVLDTGGSFVLPIASLRLAA